MTSEELTYTWVMILIKIIRDNLSYWPFIKNAPLENAVLLHPVLHASIVVFDHSGDLLNQKVIFVPGPHGFLLFYHLLVAWSRTESAIVGLQKRRIKGTFCLELLYIWRQSICVGWISKFLVFCLAFNRLLRWFDGAILDMTGVCIYFFWRPVLFVVPDRLLTGDLFICDWGFWFGLRRDFELVENRRLRLHGGRRNTLLGCQGFLGSSYPLFGVHNILKSPDLIILMRSNWFFADSWLSISLRLKNRIFPRRLYICKFWYLIAEVVGGLKVRGGGGNAWRNLLDELEVRLGHCDDWEYLIGCCWEGSSDVPVLLVEQCLSVPSVGYPIINDQV